MPAPPSASRGAGRSLALALVLSLSATGPGCRGSSPPPRVPTAAEAGSEQVVVNYAPQKLRVFPILLNPGAPNPGAPNRAAPGQPTPGPAPSEPRYLILGSERPGLPAVFRPLGVTERKAPIGVAARAGSIAWVDGHVIEAGPGGDPKAAGAPVLRIFDRDAKTARTHTLPIGCSGRSQPLLQSDGSTLWALVRCGDDAVVLVLDGEGNQKARREVRGGGDAELFLRSGEDLYVLAGRQVLRVPLEGSQPGPLAIGTVPAPAGSSETRELVRAGELILVIDGAAGRVSALGAARLERRYQQRFMSSGPITRLRAAASPDRLLLAWAEPRDGDQSEIVGLALPLAPSRARSMQRILLGSGPKESDHELVPVAPSDGGGALLVRTHASNTGPLVALLHIKL